MYMTGDEVRTLSRRIPEIINATDEELSFWMDDAFDILNNFCQQNFVYEKQATKRVRATTNTLVYLPKVLSGEVTITDHTGASIFSTLSGGSGFAPSTNVELFPGNFVLGFHRYNKQYPTNDAHTLFVTGDWGFAPNIDQFLYDAANDFKATYEQHRISTVAHNQADSLNAILSADATDFDTAVTLINELKGVINSHFGDFVVHLAQDTNIATLPDVIDQSSAFELLSELKSRFNSHVTSTVYHIEADTDNLLKTNVCADEAVLPRPIRRSYLRLVQRIAIRDDAEDHRQMSSPYTSETLGDGYTYDLSNGTLRNLLRPEEAHMLLPYVNRGRVVI